VIGENVSIAHDSRIYTLGHDVHDAAASRRAASRS
jgi:hypothetical protein